MKNPKVKLLAVSNQFTEKIKGTIVEKWVRYWKQLFLDYKDAAIDLRKDCRERPLKTVGYVSLITAMFICAKTNPDETSYRDSILQASNEVIRVHPSLQRQSSLEHLRLLEKCYSLKYIRRTSFGCFSVIWVDNHSESCKMYECTCDYLQLSYVDFFKRIIDIGFLNKWWLLEKQVEDYDVK